MTMNKQEKTLKLIEALKQEREQFKGRSQDTTEHDIAIDYLLTGSTSSNPDKWQLLDGCMNDFETMYSDYCS